MARCKLTVLAIGAAILVAGGCASSDEHRAASPGTQRPVSLSGGDGTGRMLARGSRPLAMGTIASPSQFAHVRDSEDPAGR